MQETSWEDLLESEMALHSSILAWRIPQAEEPGGLSPWGFKESDRTEQLSTWEVKWKSLSRVRLFATPWTDYTVHWLLQARVLERVAFPFSRGTTQPRDRTQVSRIAGRFFTNWAMREAQKYKEVLYILLILIEVTVDERIKNVKWKWNSLSSVRLFEILWTIQSTEFSRPEYWSG